MKRIKRIIAVLAVVLSFAILSPQAFAMTVNGDDVSVTLNADKKDYTANEPISVELKLTNNTDKPVKKVLLENVVPEGYELSGKYTCQKQLDTLAARKTVTLKNVYVTPVTSSVFTEPWFYITVAAVIAAALIALLVYRKKLKPKAVLSIVLTALILLTATPQLTLSADAAENKQATVSETITVDGETQVLKANVTYNGEKFVSSKELIDSDDDGLADYLEEMSGTDVNVQDTDGDGLSDYIELYKTKTDPLVKDSDGNGLNDGLEDSDHDGLTNKEEAEYKTNIVSADTDCDGLSDSEEINLYNTNPLKRDTDGDKISDGDEVKLGLNPLRKKSDGKTLDKNRLFVQKLSKSKIDKSLLKKSPAIPSLKGKVWDVIDNHVSISTASVYALTENTSVVGSPIEIKSDYSKKYKFTLKFDCSSYGYDTNALIISEFKDNSIIPLKTEHYDGCVTAKVTGGTYFVSNAKVQLENLGVDIADYLSGKSLAKYNKYKSISPVGDDITGGMADIVFVVDSTGSMDKILTVVEANFDSLISSITATTATTSKRYSLIEFKDITINEKITQVKNGNSNWFTDADEFKTAFKNIEVSGGGDAGESVLEALDKAHFLDYRPDANKQIILITDSYYKTNRSNALEEMAANLADSGIVASVITNQNYVKEYEPLRVYTGGAIENISNRNYADAFKDKIQGGITDRPGSDEGGAVPTTAPTTAPTTSSGGSSSGGNTGGGSGQDPQEPDPPASQKCWVILSDYTPVELDGPLNPPYACDTDGDGLKDYEELGTRTTVVLRDYIKTILQASDLPTSEYNKIKDKSTIYVYNYTSNPVLPDTDFDGINDNIDNVPKNNSFTGVHHSNYADKSPVTYQMDYKWFFNNSKTYNKQLSKMSLLYASAIYHENTLSVVDSAGNDVEMGVNGNIIKNPSGIVGVYSKLGLSDAKTYFLGDNATDIGYYKKSDVHMSEVALGHRTVTYGGQTKTILAVTVRGTNGTIEEWTSNFDIGNKNIANSEWTNKNHHKGFDIAANRIKDIITMYCNKYMSGVSSSSICYWITGHSRGAGIANLLGAHYASTNSGSTPNAWKNVFTYTFAPPASVRDYGNSFSKASNYNCIFNIINIDDFVPCLPMARWSYTLYGVTKSDGIEKNSALETQFENITGIFDYNPPSQKTLNGVKNALAEILFNPDATGNSKYKEGPNCDARETCYTYTCKHNNSNSWQEGYQMVEGHQGDSTWDKVTIKNRGTSLSSREGAIDKIPTECRDFCKITRYKGGLAWGWDFECCQTPAYFMQILAEMMADKITSYRFAVELDIADRFESAKTEIIYGYVCGIQHPHYTESYYVLADNIS